MGKTPFIFILVVYAAAIKKKKTGHGLLKKRIVTLVLY